MGASEGMYSDFSCEYGIDVRSNMREGLRRTLFGCSLRSIWSRLMGLLKRHEETV